MKFFSINRFLIVVLLSCFSSAAWSTTYLDCFKSASKHYGVPFSLLTAISFTESSYNPKALNARLNRNGTADFGFMQINTLWKKEAGRRGFSWNAIRTKPCANIKFGAWILRYNYGLLGSWKKSIGAYNAGFSKSAKAQRTRNRYYSKVIRNKGKAQRYLGRLKKRANGDIKYPGKRYAKVKSKKSTKSTSKQVAAKKKAAAAKKVAAQKKAAAAKKLAAQKKAAATKKKAVAKKKAPVKKKVVAKKKTPVKKKVVAKKKAPVKKKVVAKKSPVVVEKPVVKALEVEKPVASVKASSKDKVSYTKKIVTKKGASSKEKTPIKTVKITKTKSKADKWIDKEVSAADLTYETKPLVLDDAK